MDDLSEKLGEILNDPKRMEQVRRMAENLLGESEAEEETPQAAPDPAQLQTALSILSRLNATGHDNRSELLNALRPHLSEPRRKKVDTALKLLRLMELFPYLKESGLLNL